MLRVAPARISPTCHTLTLSAAALPLDTLPIPAQAHARSAPRHTLGLLAAPRSPCRPLDPSLLGAHTSQGSRGPPPARCCPLVNGG